jgi:hypothetical protein
LNKSPVTLVAEQYMTPELHALPEPLPPRLRWMHTQRRTAWLFDDSTCIGSLGFAGYGRASGLTSRGVWHLQRRGVLQLGVHMAPADGRRAPMLMRQSWSFDGTLDLPGDEPVEWRALGSLGDTWAFARVGDGARLLTFRTSGALQTETMVEVAPAASTLGDASPLLLLGAFLVRLAVDDSVVIAGA